MSKELTEQYYDGTLPCGFYYTRTKDGMIRTDDDKCRELTEKVNCEMMWRNR